MLNLDSYWEKITAKFLDGTCTHHGLPAGGILFTFCIQTVSPAIFFVVFTLTSSRRVCNQQLDPQAAAIGPVCFAGFAQVLQHVFGMRDSIVLVSKLRRCETAFKATVFTPVSLRSTGHWASPGQAWAWAGQGLAPRHRLVHFGRQPRLQDSRIWILVYKTWHRGPD